MADWMTGTIIGDAATASFLVNMLATMNSDLGKEGVVMTGLSVEAGVIVQVEQQESQTGAVLTGGGGYGGSGGYHPF